MPHIRVDEAGRSISATDNKGEVQIRINGILANMHDVQMLDVASIMSVDYIDSPGVRYGKNIAYVIDIHTCRASSGGSLGFNLTNALTTKLGSNDVYASVNRGKSQLNIYMSRLMWIIRHPNIMRMLSIFYMMVLSIRYLENHEWGNSKL